MAGATTTGAVHVRRRRRNHERVNRLRDRDVLDRGIDVGLMLFIRREHAGNDFLSGKRGEGEGTYELLGSARHHNLYVDATILQQADNFCRLRRGRFSWNFDC